MDSLFRMGAIDMVNESHRTTVNTVDDAGAEHRGRRALRR